MDKKYWEDLNKYPPLSKEKEKEVAIKAKAGDKKSHDLLINSNLRFVVSVAKEYHTAGMPFEDLVSYGNLGLCRAFDRYDPDKNIKFITYAVWWIRQSIVQALNESGHLIKIPHYQLTARSSVEKTREKLAQENQREVTDSEVESVLGKPIKNESFKIISLDKSYTKDLNKAIINVLENKEATDPSDEMNTQAFFEELDYLLSDFSERERDILKKYHGIGYVRGMTLEEIGVDLGITRERVRQIKAKTLKKLRHKSRSSKLKPYLAVLKSEILNDIPGPK